MVAEPRSEAVDRERMRRPQLRFAAIDGSVSGALRKAAAAVPAATGAAAIDDEAVPGLVLANGRPNGLVVAVSLPLVRPADQ